MEIERLKLALSRQMLSLLVNSIAFTASLFIVNKYQSLLSILVVLILSWYIFRKFISGHIKISFTFFVFILISILLAINLSSYIAALSFISLGAVLFLFLSSSVVLFSHHKNLLAIALYIVLFLSVLIIYNGVWERPWITLPISFFVYFMLGKDFVKSLVGEVDKRIISWLAVISFMSVQILWIGSIMSISYFGVASLILIFWMVMLDILIKLFNGDFCVIEAKKNIVLFLSSSIAVILFTTLV